MLRLLERWIGFSDELFALKRYFRDERLTADLELQLIRERESGSNLERTLYAARSYFAA